jgi:hypothetical protein
MRAPRGAEQLAFGLVNPDEETVFRPRFGVYGRPPRTAPFCLPPKFRPLPAGAHASTNPFLIDQPRTRAVIILVIHDPSRMSTRRSFIHPDSSRPFASRSPLDVEVIRVRSSPSRVSAAPTRSARDWPSTKLYSSSPRGSARPTSLSEWPLSSPCVKHLATLPRAPISLKPRNS